MRREKDVDGKRMFSIDEFLTHIKSAVFSPKVAKRRQKQIPEEDDDMSNMLNADEETYIEQLQSCGRHALF